MVRLQEVYSTSTVKLHLAFANSISIVGYKEHKVPLLLATRSTKYLCCWLQGAQSTSIVGYKEHKVPLLLATRSI